MSRNALCRFAAAATPLMWMACAQAQLHWNSTQSQIEGRLGQKMVSAPFQFKNVGARNVTIFGLKDGCGCSTSNLAQRVYGPGENGDFVLSFNIDGRPGHVVKHAAVQTDDPYQPQVQLAVIVRTPEALTLDPPSVHWRVGDPPSERTIAMTLSDTPGIAIEPIAPVMADRFSARLEGEGRHLKLLIKPITTEGPARAALRIDVRFGQGIRQTYHVQASIRP